MGASPTGGLAWGGGVLAGRDPRLELLYWRLMACCDSMASDTSATAASSPAATIAHSLHVVGALIVCACLSGRTVDRDLSVRNEQALGPCFSLASDRTRRGTQAASGSSAHAELSSATITRACRPVQGWRAMCADTQHCRAAGVHSCCARARHARAQSVPLAGKSKLAIDSPLLR